MQLLHTGLSTLKNSHRYPTCFIGVKSYVNDKQQPQIGFYGAPSIHLIKKKQVVLVDDVVDSGNTILGTVEYLKQKKQATHIAAVALCVKGDRPRWLSEEAVAFQLPKSEFIVGFGMDYNRHYRDLDEIRPITAGEREAAAVPLRTEANGGIKTESEGPGVGREHEEGDSRLLRV
jgi:hypoxanthine phosphoribosyltransferase